MRLYLKDVPAAYRFEEWQYSIGFIGKQDLRISIDEWALKTFGTPHIEWSPRIGGWYFKNKKDMFLFSLVWA